MKLGVEIIGDSTSLKAALGSASAATEKFAAGYRSTFAGMTTSTLQLAVAQDKLAISTARYGVGTTGAAAATVKYRQEVDRLAISQKRAMGDIGRSITRGITLPTVILGAVAVKMGVDFSKQMLQIQTSAGASAEEVKKLSGEVLNLGPKVAMGPSELARGLYHLESLGLRGSEAMAALKTSAIAAGMGVANLEDVTTALGGAIVSGIKGAENFDKAMGTLKATIGVGNMRLEDMVGFMGTGVLPAAKNAGLSLDQVGAALAVMTDRGISAENAGTRLRMTFALMQSPSDNAVRALADMGISADEMAGKLREPDGLLKVLEMLKKGMDNVGKVRGSADILKSFGGGRSGAAILTLIQSLDSAVSSFGGKLEDIRAGQQSFAHNTKVYMESPAFKLEQALAKLQTSFTKLGTSLTPAIVGMAKVIGGIATAFDKLPSIVKTEIGVIIGILAVGGPLMLAIAAVSKAVRSIGLAFGFIPGQAATAAVATDASMATMGATATATAGKVAGIRLAFMRLGKIGAILIPIQIAINVSGDWDKFKKLVKSGMLGSAALQALFGTTFGSEKWFQKPEKTPKGQPPAGVQGPVGTPGVAGPFAEGEGAGRNAAEVPPPKPVPTPTLPRALKESMLWAQISPGLKDDLREAKKQEAYFRLQLSRADKGTEVYDTILTDLEQAVSATKSIASQIASAAKKASHVKPFKLPANIASALSVAQRSGSDEKELAALNKAVVFLKHKIATEKNAIKHSQEEAKLTQIMAKIASVKKRMGSKVIAKMQAAVDVAATTPGMSDDLAKLAKLRSALIKQIALQKGNNELQTKLNEVTNKFKEIRQQFVDDARSAFGSLGAGPSGEASETPFAKWKLGVQFSGKQYLKDLQRQILEFKMLQNNFDALAKKGAPKAMIDELRSQGQAAFPEVFALAHADKGTLTKFFAAYKEREKLVQNVATVQMQAGVVNINGKAIGSPSKAPYTAVGPGGPRYNGGKDSSPGKITAVGPGGPKYHSSPAGRMTPVIRKSAMAGVGEIGSASPVPMSKDKVAPGPIHVTLEMDGHQVGTVLINDFQGRAKGNAAQTRGRAGGVRLNLA